MSGIQPGTIAMHLSRRAQVTNAEVLEQFLAAGKKKAAYGHLKLFFLSVLGGLFLGLGRLRRPRRFGVCRRLPICLRFRRGLGEGVHYSAEGGVIVGVRGLVGRRRPRLVVRRVGRRVVEVAEGQRRAGTWCRPTSSRPGP